MTTETKRNRKRRTPDQIVADLEAEIERVKARAAAKEAKQSAEGKAFIAAVKALDKAMETAKTEDVHRALEAARVPISEQMIRMGIRLSSRRRARSRP